MKFFISRGISTRDSGENIGSGWIGIYECPYCGKPNYHFGMNLKNKYVSCWVCTTTKPLPAYIMKIDRCSYEKAMETIIAFSSGDLNFDGQEIQRNQNLKVKKPTGIDTVFRDLFKDFLRERGFSDVDFIIRKYNLLCTTTFSEIPSRILFPFYQNNKLMTYIHRKIHQKEYRNWPAEKSILDPKSLLYNIDFVKKEGAICITEGVFDVIKGGDSFVGTSGFEYTSEQIKLILDKKPKRVFIIFDPEPEAQKKAKQLQGNLALFCNHVENIFLTEASDVGNMSEDDIRHLRSELKL